MIAGMALVGLILFLILVSTVKEQCGKTVKGSRLIAAGSL
jgi:hypothetical protein